MLAAGRFVRGDLLAVECALVTPPSEEPVTLAEAKLHLRVDGTSDDTLIARLITQAREWVEAYTRRGLVTQTWLGYEAFFPTQITLGRGPVTAVTQVEYTDPAGTVVALDPSQYRLFGLSPNRRPRIVPAYGVVWPSTRKQEDAVRVTFTVGYGAAASVPARFKQAILLHAGWHYEHREPLSGGGAEGGAFEQFRVALEQQIADLRLFTFG